MSALVRPGYNDPAMTDEASFDARALFAAHADDLEDFWGRRRHGPAYTRAFHLFGRPVRLAANVLPLLEAVDAVLPLYSTASPVAAPALHLHLVAAEALAGAGPPPPDLFDRIHYAGHGAWISLHLGPWGMAWADLAAGTARAVVAPALASRPAAVARFLLNTLLLNLLDGRGFSMVHATSLVRSGRLLLLMGPHNSGKSTAALHLALAGYRFLADSQLYVTPRRDVLELVGFPVGQTKLRPDMVDAFPRLRPSARPEQVRHEQKYRVDLREVDPALIQEEALVDPPAVHLCLVARHSGSETERRSAGRAEMRAALVHNGPFWNEPARWHDHLRRLERMLVQAECHHLRLGTEPAGLLAALAPLFP